MIKRNKIKKELIAYSFIMPNVIGVSIFMVLPILFTLVISFSSWDYTLGFKGIEFNGIDNYVRMWSDQWFIDSLVNNLKYSFFTVVLTVFIAFVFAILVEEFVLFKQIIRLALFIPYITNIVVVCYVWQMMLSKNGIITQIVKFIGVENPPFWLGSTDWSLIVIMAIGIWVNVGYVFVLYVAGLKNVPGELYESAIIDGANWFKKIWHITIPMVSPTTFFIITTQLIFSFRVFAQVNILTNGGPGTSSSVLAYYTYLLAFRFYKIGYASSITWILFIIIFLVTLVQWKGQKKWERRH